MAELCPDEILAALAQAAGEDTREGLRRADALLGDYPDDPRLHFLKGSLLAALQRYPEAEAAMREAIEIAPGFDIARFQLGLLHLSSGAAVRALEIWGPLSGLAASAPLRLFAEGLQHMVRNDFATASRMLHEGMAANHEHPPLNRDMQMMLDRMQEVGAPTPPSDPADPAAPTDETISSAHWLLQVSAAKPTRH